jgi:[protein-PII] uridylyltransferase
LFWRERRESLRVRLRHRPPPHISAEEIEVHFSAMPSHYWEHVTESDLVWGMETIHGFLQLVASPDGSATAPLVSWRGSDEPSCTRVMLCTWDRHSLAAKAAAAFSAVGLKIVQADICTRADHIVLDEFSVTDADGSDAVADARLRKMTSLLEGALSEPPRLVSLWACAPEVTVASHPVAPEITFDNERSPNWTLVRIEAADRLGLLCDILQVIADAGLNTRHARIETDANLAHDSIYVTDRQGRKLPDDRLAWLRARLEAVLRPTG